MQLEAPRDAVGTRHLPVCSTSSAMLCSRKPAGIAVGSGYRQPQSCQPIATILHHSEPCRVPNASPSISCVHLQSFLAHPDHPQHRASESPGSSRAPKAQGHKGIDALLCHPVPLAFALQLLDAADLIQRLRQGRLHVRMPSPSAAFAAIDAIQIFVHTSTLACAGHCLKSWPLLQALPSMIACSEDVRHRHHHLNPDSLVPTAGILACVSLTTVAASISSCTAAPAAVIASLATSSAVAADADSVAAFSSVHRTCARSRARYRVQGPGKDRGEVDGKGHDTQQKPRLLHLCLQRPFQMPAMMTSTLAPY